MTDPNVAWYWKALDEYSPELLEAVAGRVGRASKTSPDARTRLAKGFEAKASLLKRIRKLPAEDQLALSVLAWSAPIPWRWDNAVRLLQSSNVPSPLRSLRLLLDEGFLAMGRRNADRPLSRFELADGAPLESLPEIVPAPAVVALREELPAPIAPIRSVPLEGPARQADGWELPIRLGVLWAVANYSPIKRTQQRVLFKRDHERIVANPLMIAPMADELVSLPQPGLFVYSLALAEGWLDGQSDEQTPPGMLRTFWPASRAELAERLGAAAVVLEDWSELGPKAPIGPFLRESASARGLLLLLLGTLPEGHGASVQDFADRLAAAHPPWNKVTEVLGPLRNDETRAQMCLEWTRHFLLGVLFQLGLVKLHGPRDNVLIALSDIGRHWLGHTANLPEEPVYPQTLLVQPNYEMIVYRQGLSVGLLSNLFAFAEPKNAGGALTFEITANSIYHGLESGMTETEIRETLAQANGRELPPAVSQSIRDWSQKRDRITVFQDAHLFEFESEADRNEAMSRGLEGTPITDRMLVSGGPGERNLQPLRITASRDYKLAKERCVEVEADGVTLSVDLAKSDLMLDAELRRFADPAPTRDSHGRPQFRVTPASVRRAVDQGMRLESLEEWFRSRTGADPAAAVLLLVRAAIGLTVQVRRELILSVDAPLVADGLLQHPLTRELVGKRLGPMTLTMADANLPRFQEALADLGISLPDLAAEEPSNRLPNA